MNAPIPPVPFRRVVCARCGALFDCGGEACWCAAEPYRLPMPDAATAECLCPACLRLKAQAAQAKQA